MFISLPSLSINTPLCKLSRIGTRRHWQNEYQLRTSQLPVISDTHISIQNWSKSIAFHSLYTSRQPTIQIRISGDLMMYWSALHRLHRWIITFGPKLIPSSRVSLLFNTSTIFELSPRVPFAIPPKWHDFKRYVKLWTSPPSCSYQRRTTSRPSSTHWTNSDTYKVSRW